MARWQLMQEYAQKSISTTLPRNALQIDRLAAGCVQPRGDALEVRCVPQLCSSADSVGAVRQLARSVR